MDKELEKLLDEMIEKFGEVKTKKSNLSEDQQADLEHAKKQIKMVLDNFNPECMVFGSPYGSLQVGRESEILACVAMIINRIKENTDIDKIIYTVLVALAEPEENGEPKLDLDTVNVILETLKKLY